jgi:hypothetical protein
MHHEHIQLLLHTAPGIFAPFFWGCPRAFAEIVSGVLGASWASLSFIAQNMGVGIMKEGPVRAMNLPILLPQELTLSTDACDSVN